MIQELPHKVFKREKNNLRMKLKISLKDALLGFRKVIEHLDGHKVTIKKDGVTQPGETDNFTVGDHVKLLNRYLIVFI